MKQLMAEYERRAALRLHRSVEECRLASFEIVIQIEHQGEAAFLSAAPTVYAVNMPRKPLALLVAIKSESLIQTYRLPAIKEPRQIIAQSQPQQSGQPNIIINDAIIVANTRIANGAFARVNGRSLIAELLRSRDMEGAPFCALAIRNGVDTGR
jgi:hypothetical protein